MKSTPRQRLAALRAKMARHGADLVAIGPGLAYALAAGLPPASRRAALPAAGRPAEGDLPDAGAQCRRFARGDRHRLPHLGRCRRPACRACRGTCRYRRDGQRQNVVLDETMRADFALLLLDALPGAEPQLHRPRRSARCACARTPPNTTALKMNAGIADRAMQKAFAPIKPGMTRARARRGHQGPLRRGRRDAGLLDRRRRRQRRLPASPDRRRKLAEGDAIVIDIGGRKDGFPCDITRMAVVGRPPEGYGQIHAIVEKAVQAALKAARPGVAGEGGRCGRARRHRRCRLWRVFRAPHRPRHGHRRP